MLKHKYYLLKQFIVGTMEMINNTQTICYCGKTTECGISDEQHAKIPTIHVDCLCGKKPCKFVKKYLGLYFSDIIISRESVISTEYGVYAKKNL